MDPFYAYSFLLGIYVGQYTNLFSTVVISGLVVYMVHPNIFTVDKFNPLYRLVYEKSKPILSKVYEFENPDSSLNSSNVPLQITDVPQNEKSKEVQENEKEQKPLFQITIPSLPSLPAFSIKSLPNVTALADGSLNVKIPNKK